MSVDHQHVVRVRISTDSRELIEDAIVAFASIGLIPTDWRIRQGRRRGWNAYGRFRPAAAPVDDVPALYASDQEVNDAIDRESEASSREYES